MRSLSRAVSCRGIVAACTGCLPSRPHGRLQDLLHRAVWDRLDWSRLPETEQDRQTLVETCVRTLNQLDACRRDVEGLVRAACQTNLEFRQEKGPTHTASRDAALEEKLNEMPAEAGSDWLPPRCSNGSARSRH